MRHVSTWKEFHPALSYIFGPQADFIIVSSSKTTNSKDAWQSVAMCFVPENSRSQGTDDVMLLMEEHLRQSMQELGIVEHVSMS